MENLRKRLGATEGSGIWDAVQTEFAASFDGAEISKVGFAKEVAAYVDAHRDEAAPSVAMAALESNFAALIATLAERLEGAENEELSRGTNRRSDRLIKSFMDDYPESPIRDRALKFLRNLEGSLEDTRGDDQVGSAIRRPSVTSWPTAIENQGGQATSQRAARPILAGQSTKASAASESAAWPGM